jgi:site-specific DNA-methyltransferase (adenine-specific)
MDTNVLYYGDNLDILRHHIPDNSIDLIYLDPPFNSQANYNVLFREETGAVSHAQIEAFEDTWHWSEATAQAYDEVLRGPRQPVARMLKAMVDGLGHNQVTAYLAMMAIRLIELRRVLKDSGSIYLHCDPTAGAYLKVLMDSVFTPANFRNEITWKRTSGHSDARRYGRVHDTLLFYVGSDSAKWNETFQPYDEAYVEQYYRYQDADGRKWMSGDASASGLSGGGYDYEWKGVRRTWRFPIETMTRLDKQARIFYTRNGIARIKRYLDESRGLPVQDVWTDVEAVRSWHTEILNYPTQKPLGLLERIIETSSNPGDIVLDPFCGCGTAVHAAQKLGRRWIGIDITHLAIGLIRRRMKDAFPDLDIKVIGEPVDLPGARDLALQDKYQFQWWALDQVGAQPVAGKKKGADRGIDGVIPILVGGTAARPEYARAIVSVKGGGVSSPMIRDLKGVLDREGEPVGILLTLTKPTKEMTTEAAASGYYESPLWQKKYPRIQIITIEDLLNGKRPDLPSAASPFAKAPLEREKAEQERLV